MRTSLAFTLALSAAAVLPGCAKFKASRRADLGPFAEQTVATISQLDQGLKRRRGVLLQEYGGYVSETFRDAELRIAQIDELLRLIVTYSVDVVSISRSGADEPEMAVELADALDEFGSSAVFARVSGEEYDLDLAETLSQVRGQETLLAALAAAQPIINATGRYAADVAVKVREDALEVERDLRAQIQERFAELLRFERLLDRQMDEVMGGLALLEAHRRGEPDALSALLAGELFTAAERAEMEDEPRRLESALRVRLAELARSAEDAAPRRESFTARLTELRVVLDELDAKLRETWGVIFVWTRAHDRMARGVVDPAEWFDLSDAPGTVFRLAGSAL